MCYTLAKRGGGYGGYGGYAQAANDIMHNYARPQVREAYKIRCWAYKHRSPVAKFARAAQGVSKQIKKTIMDMKETHSNHTEYVPMSGEIVLDPFLSYALLDNVLLGSTDSSRDGMEIKLSGIHM